MRTTVEFIDAVKSLHGFTSDYQVSVYLGLTRAAISSYRHGKTYLSDDVAVQIARELGKDAGYVLSCVAAERASSPAVVKAWKETARRLAQTAAVASMALGMALMLSDPLGRAYAASGAPVSAALHNHARAASVLNIMRSVRRLAARCARYLKSRTARP